MSEENFEIIDVEYLISLAVDHSMALIKPQLKIGSSAKQVLVGEVRLDGIDMIPSFRVRVEVGENTVELKPITVYNPHVRMPEDEEGVKYYNMEVMLFASFSSAKIHSKAIAVTPDAPVISE